jgi:hypothetical protein
MKDKIFVQILIMDRGLLNEYELSDIQINNLLDIIDQMVRNNISVNKLNK